MKKSEKKYELTDNIKIIDGHVLHQIQALKSFSALGDKHIIIDTTKPSLIVGVINNPYDVPKGKLGGWVESEKNLSHKGSCWVSDNACVFGDSIVSDNAIVKGSAIIKNKSRIFMNACVTDCAIVSNSYVYGDAILNMRAYIHDEAKIYGQALITDSGIVSDNSEVFGDASVHEMAVIKGSSMISGMSVVKGSAFIDRDSEIFGKSCISGLSVIDLLSNCYAVTIKDSARIIRANIYKSEIAGSASIDGTGPYGNKPQIMSSDEYLTIGPINRKFITFFVIDRNPYHTIGVSIDSYNYTLDKFESQFPQRFVSSYNKDYAMFEDAISMAKKFLLPNSDNSICRKKYTLSEETKEVDGHILHRVIPYLSNFESMEFGTSGGWIEKEENLSQDGTCWVYQDACVYGDARVKDCASVFNNAIVKDNAIVKGCVNISNNAIISGHAVISDDATVKDFANISGYAHILDDAYICDNSFVSDHAIVSNKAMISGASCVMGHSKVYDRAIVQSSNLDGSIHIFNNAAVINSIVNNRARIFDSASIIGVTVNKNACICGSTKIDTTCTISKNAVISNDDDFTSYNGFIGKDDAIEMNISIYRSLLGDLMLCDGVHCSMYHSFVQYAKKHNTLSKKELSNLKLIKDKMTKK